MGGVLFHTVKDRATKGKKKSASYAARTAAVVVAVGAACIACSCDARKARLELLACDESVREYVSLEPDSVTIYASPEDRRNGKIECRIYADEYETAARIFRTFSKDEIEALYLSKGAERFADDVVAKARDRDVEFLHRGGGRPLEGIRIALDPGHSASNMDEAKRESKYMLLYAPDGRRLTFFEAALNLETAKILKRLLEDDGATVMMTRETNRVVYPERYERWRRRFRRAVHEKMKSRHITAEQGRLLLRTLDERRRYRFFASEYEMPNRARLINSFRPHLTVLIHYDASWPANAAIQIYGRVLDAMRRPCTTMAERRAAIDEARDAIPVTEENRSTVFVPGCFLKGELETVESRIELLRLIITDDIEQSIELAARVAKRFHKNLGVPFESGSMQGGRRVGLCTPGVYARNFRMTRLVRGPVCLGEPLYQNNLREAERLALLTGGIVPDRIELTARAYHEAIREYVRKKAK